MDFQKNVTAIVNAFGLSADEGESDPSYFHFTILPTIDDCVFHCREANKLFQEFVDSPPEEINDIITWRVTYMALDDFNFPDHLANDKEVLLFKTNHEYSIDYFYDLLERTEELNRYEKVTVSYIAQTDGIDETIYLSTAISPNNDDKYDHSLCNLSLENHHFGAFYLKKEDPIQTINLRIKKFDAPVKIFIIGVDDTILSIPEADSEVFLASNSKGILFLNKLMFEEAIACLSVGSTQLVIKNI